MSDHLGDHRCDRGGLSWVDTLGGPHILVPQSALPYWDGAPMNASVGPAHALVLGSEPGLTTFLADRKALVRWVGADSEEGIVHAAMEVMDAGSVPARRAR